MKYAILLFTSLLLVSCSSTDSRSSTDRDVDTCAEKSSKKGSQCKSEGISFGDGDDMEIKSKKKVKF